MHLHHRQSLVFCLFIAVIFMAGCPQKRDLDGTCATAKGLNTFVVVTDQLDVKAGDRSDCRKMSFASQGVAVVSYTIGRPFEKHKLHGEIVAYNSNEIVVAKERVVPETKTIELRFPVEAKKPYYVDFKALSGKHGYTIKLSHENECAKCGPAEECVDGRCQAKQCKPACDDFSEVCDAGQCVSPCQPGCRSGKVCDAQRRRCVRRCRKVKKCSSKQYWSTSSCKCRTKAPSCAAGCPPGTVCRSGRCRAIPRVCPSTCPKGQHCNAGTGNICKKKPCKPANARATSRIRDGDNTVILVNVGSKHGVRTGATGKMCGKSLKVLAVYPSGTRAKARVRASLEEIANCPTATISRRCD